jgi:hypothetical protein
VLLSPWLIMNDCSIAVTAPQTLLYYTQAV